MLAIIVLRIPAVKCILNHRWSNYPHPRNDKVQTAKYLEFDWSNGVSSGTAAISKLGPGGFGENNPGVALMLEPKLPKLKCEQSACVTCKWLGIITAGLSSADGAPRSPFCRFNCCKFAAVDDISSLTSSTGKIKYSLRKRWRIQQRWTNIKTTSGSNNYMTI